MKIQIMYDVNKQNAARAYPSPEAYSALCKSDAKKALLDVVENKISESVHDMPSTTRHILWIDVIPREQWTAVMAILKSASLGSAEVKRFAKLIHEELTK